MSTIGNLGHQRKVHGPAKHTSECESGVGKHTLELRTNKKICKIQGKHFTA